MLYSIYYFLESVLSLFLVFVVGTINIYLFIYLLVLSYSSIIPVGLYRKHRGGGGLKSVYPRFQNLSYCDVTELPTTPYYVCSKIAIFFVPHDPSKNLSSVLWKCTYRNRLVGEGKYGNYVEMEIERHGHRGPLVLNDFQL